MLSCLDLKTIFITGATGFIDSNLVKCLLNQKEEICIIGIGNMNDYYDVFLKEYRLAEIKKLASELSGKFIFIKGSIEDANLISDIFAMYYPDIVVNLEACRHSYDGGAKGVEHLVYASSSSVYGSDKKIPYSTDDKVDNRVSLYVATKKSNELMAHVYSKLYNISSTGLRFFTVYGPAGRPDMAYFGFTNKLLKGEKIQIFNYGNCKRDFTYIDDIVEGVIRVMQKAPERIVGEDGLPPYAVYNIGNNQPKNLLDFVKILSKELVAMQLGDVPITYADTFALERDFGVKPSTSLRDGLRKFAEWYHEFYQNN